MTDDEITAQAIALSAQRAAAQRGAGSILPPDPALPPDAQQLRTMYKTPQEMLMAIANDTSLDIDVRMAAMGKLLPYTARQPAARSEVAVSDDTHAASLLAAMRAELKAGTLTRDELVAMRDACDDSGNASSMSH